MAMHSPLRRATLVAVLTFLALTGCGSGSGTPDGTPPEITMVLLGGVFRMDCDPAGECPDAPMLGANSWAADTVYIPVDLWNGSARQIGIDLSALDLGGVREIGVNLRLVSGLTIVDDGGADEIPILGGHVLTLRGDPATVLAALSTRVIIELLTQGDGVSIDAWATDLAGNTTRTETIHINIT